MRQGGILLDLRLCISGAGYEVPSRSLCRPRDNFTAWMVQARSRRSD